MIINSIRQAFSAVQKPTISGLQQALESLEDAAEELLSYIEEPEKLSYGRSVLYRSEQVEVILIHIPEGCRTAIHDHGRSIGCANVLEGECTNIIYNLDPYGYPAKAGEHVIGKQQYFQSEEGLIHEMANHGEGRLITLHAYSPPLSGTRIYAPYSEVLQFVI